MGYGSFAVSNDLRPEMSKNYFVFTIICTAALMVVFVSYTISKGGDTDGNGELDAHISVLILIAFLMPWLCCSSCIYLAYQRSQLLKADHSRNR